MIEFKWTELYNWLVINYSESKYLKLIRTLLRSIFPQTRLIIIIVIVSIIILATFLLVNFFSILRDLVTNFLNFKLGSKCPDDRNPIIISTVSNDALKLCIVFNSLIISDFRFSGIFY